MTAEQLESMLGRDTYNKLLANSSYRLDELLKFGINTIDSAFAWHTSPEGSDFWVQVHRDFHIKYKEVMLGIKPLAMCKLGDNDEF